MSYETCQIGPFVTIQSDYMMANPPPDIVSDQPFPSFHDSVFLTNHYA